MRTLNCIKPARQSKDINMYENLQHIQLAVDGHQTHLTGQDGPLATTFSLCYGFKSYLPISRYFQALTPLATPAGFKSLKYLLIGIITTIIYKT